MNNVSQFPTSGTNRHVGLIIPPVEQILADLVDVDIHFEDGMFAEFTAYLAVLEADGYAVETKYGGVGDDFPLATCTKQIGTGGSVTLNVYGPSFEPREERLPPIEETIAVHRRRQEEARAAALDDDAPRS